MYRLLFDYVKSGVYPSSGFIMALLENNLSQAWLLADEDNRTRLHEYAEFLWNEIPAISWGSEQKITDYIKSFEQYLEK